MNDNVTKFPKAPPPPPPQPPKQRPNRKTFSLKTTIGSSIVSFLMAMAFAMVFCVMEYTEVARNSVGDALLAGIFMAIKWISGGFFVLFVWLTIAVWFYVRRT